VRGAKDNFCLTANWNMGEISHRNKPGDSSLIDFLERRQWIIELDSCEKEPELYEGLVLPRWLQKIPRGWLCVPLLQGCHLLGFIVLAKPIVKQRLNWEDHDLLKTAGRQVASYVALLDTTDALTEARQFETFNRLSAYVVHDLKNITAQLTLLITNAARHKNNPAFMEDAIRTIENATAKMQRMLSQLRKGEPIVSESSLFNIGEVVKEVVVARIVARPRPVLKTVDGSLYLQANRDRFVAILAHLVQNAQEATSADGKVEITVYRDDHKAVIEVTDNGCGMDERFIQEHLFRPFDTTKGNAGMGIGVYEAREFTFALGGDIDVVSRPGSGTTFFLRLPLAEKSGITQDSRQEIEVSLVRSEKEITHHRG
jgi:putative PEP-CTERM system histidine kinase